MTRGEQIQKDVENVTREAGEIRAMGGDPAKILKDFLESASERQNFETLGNVAKLRTAGGLMLMLFWDLWENKP